MGCAGLVPALLLGESSGLHELLGEHLSVDSPNPVLKSAGVVAGMLAGADSIDDLDVLRHGGMPKLFGGIRAPSTEVPKISRTVTPNRIGSFERKQISDKKPELFP